MVFSAVMRLLKDGQAAKTPTMLGYVYRTDFTKGESDAWREKYTIGFKERSDSGDVEGGSGDGPDGDGRTFYPYVFTVAPDGKVTVTDPEGGMKLDGQLLQCLAMDTWEIYDAAVLEETRKGTGSRW